MIAWWWPIGRVRNVVLASSLAAFLGFPLTVWPQLNDTGVDQYSDGGSFTFTEPAVYPAQDPRYGRDAAAAVGGLPKVGGGAVGFDFTKLGTDGTKLAVQNAAWDNNGAEAEGTQWSCVQDNVTGLVWEVKTADGGLRDQHRRYSWYSSDSHRNGGEPGTQTPSNNPAVCGGAPANCNTEAYVAAINQAGLCGANDWRLPTVDELSSILDFGIAYLESTIDEDYFPNTVGSWYWSSSVSAVDPTTAYVLYFYFGGSSTHGKDSDGRVRLVRGGQPLVSGTPGSRTENCNGHIPESTPTADFTLNDNGTALHGKTNLMWMRCALGQTWNRTTSTCTGSPLTLPWQLGLQGAAGFSFAGYDDWRLPNHKELSSILERRCYNPAINTTVFPSTPPYWFWSSSVYAGDPSTAWSLNFGYGFDLTYGKDAPFDIRLVRGGQRFADSFLEQLTVTISGLGFGTVTSLPAGINCGATCQADFISGAVVTLYATPAAGSVFAGWSGDCNSGGQVTMSASNNCIATFNPLPPRTLTVTLQGTGRGTVISNPGGIRCGATCQQTFNLNTPVTLTATSAVGSVFAGWSGDADCSDGQVTMNANKACTATFSRQQYTLTVTTTGGSGVGTVTSNPGGINCGATCQASYPSATFVALTATPAAGYIFNGWNGDPDCSDGQVTMSASITCTAGFERLHYTLYLSKAGTGLGTVTSDASGGINCDKDCQQTQNTYAFGKVVTLTATADAGSGSVFAGWSEDCSSSGQVTMTADKVCVASFNKTWFTLNVTTVGSGRVSSAPTGISCGVDCQESYISDTKVTLTATPAVGYILSGWGGDSDCSDGQVTMDANKTCTAYFTRQQYTLTVNNVNGLALESTVTSANPVGGINCGVDCQETYNSSTLVTLTANLAPGVVFSGWSGACTGLQTTCLITMSGNQSVTAVFFRP